MNVDYNDPVAAAKWIKQRGKEFGADLVGIAPMSRFEGAPKLSENRC